MNKKPDDKKRPVMLAFAGPNGSGKTTVAKSITPFGTYVNADDIKKDYSLTDIEAAQAAESLRYKLLEKGLDFSFETVLSTERNLVLMQKAKAAGYIVKCVYVLTCDVNINVLRVRERFQSGGHDVPEDKILKRYHRALALLPKVIGVCNDILIYDNTDMPCIIFSKNDTHIQIRPNKYWTDAKIKNLVGL